MLVGGIAVSGDWERQSAEHEIKPLPRETAQAAKVARDGLCPSWPGVTPRAASHVTPRLSVSGWRSSKNPENAGGESSLEVPLETGQTHGHVFVGSAVGPPGCRAHVTGAYGFLSWYQM